MRFQAKLYLFFALTVILPICVATAAISIVFTRASSQNAQNRLEDAARVGQAHVQVPAGILEAQVADQVRSQPALLDAAASGDASRAQPALASIAAATGASQTALYTTDGRLVSQFQQQNTASGCQTGVRIPITEQGVTRGYVTAASPLDQDFLQSVLSGIGYAGLISCQGAPSSSTFPGAQPDQLGQLAQGQASGTSFNAQVGGEEYQLYQSTIEGDGGVPPIVLTTGIPAGEINNYRTIVLEAGISLVAFTLLIASLLGFLVTRSITRPLRLLTGAVLKAEEGDLDVTVDLGSQDELGVLARNFNRMIKQIRNFIAELRREHQRLLQAFSNAGELMVSSYDRDRLYHTLTDTVSLATNSAASAFYVFGGAAGQEPASPGRLQPAEFFTGERRQKIEDVIRRIRTGEIEGMVDQPLESGFRLIVAPITLQQHSFGALVAIVESDGEAVEVSSSVMLSLANQAATALENVRLNEALREMVITDSLTGLRNVRFFKERLSDYFELSRRHRNKLSLLIIDLDHFKAVNDTYGHLAGDEVLRRVGRLLAENVRQTDVAARYGGEEFAIILPQTSKTTAFKVAEKLRTGARSLQLPEHPDITVSFSVGVASFPDDASNVQMLIQTADNATYKAKKLGRNRTVAA